MGTECGMGFSMIIFRGCSFYNFVSKLEIIFPKNQFKSREALYKFNVHLGLHALKFCTSFQLFLPLIQGRQILKQYSVFVATSFLKFQNMQP